MCNLYSLTSSQAAIRQLVGAIDDRLGNLPPMPSIYPDQQAPIVRTTADGGRELAFARWGMPSPAFALKGHKVDRGVTNIRNSKSPHWRRWLDTGSRCLVPFTAFSEPERGPDGRSRPVWFAPRQPPETAFFAGIWTSWTSTRKLAEGEITADLFGFLTTGPNREVAPIHPKAMPVILTAPQEWDLWLTAPWAEASALQRPLPDGALSIVARGPSPEDSAPGLPLFDPVEHSIRK